MGHRVPDDVFRLTHPEPAAPSEDPNEVLRQYAMHRPDAWRAALSIRESQGVAQACHYLLDLMDDESMHVARAFCYVCRCIDMDDKERSMARSFTITGPYIETQNINKE